MGEFLTGNEWYWRLARTIAQGIIGVVIANIDMIVGWGVIDPAVRALVVALVMAILSPIMSELGAVVDDRGFVIPRGGE